VPNPRTLLPILAVVLLLFIVLPLLTHKKKHGLTDAVRAADTQAALNLVGGGEHAYKAANGRYTSHLADVLTQEPGLVVQLDVTSDGKGFFARVDSSVLSLIRAPNGKVDCLYFKSSVKPKGTPCRAG
jgi:hypothetical protein